MSSGPVDQQPRGPVGPEGHTVTGAVKRHAAHAARPGVGSRAVLTTLALAVLIAGTLAALVQQAGSVPSAPESAQRITAPPRTSTIGSADALLGRP